MNALITGASGFVATHLAAHLRAAGDSVLATCRTSEHSVPAFDVGDLIPWDIAQPATGAIIEKIRHFEPHVVYHLAAISHPGSCGKDEPTPECQAINVDGTRHVAQLALALPGRPRLLFTSSSKVYGPRAPENPWAKETDEPDPLGGYAVSKWQAEQLLREMSEKGLDVVIARAFNHTGPGQQPLYLVPEWCEKVASGTSPVTVRSLTTTLDLSDVRDVARIYRSLAAKGRTGETYNVGRGEAITTGEIWNLLLEVSGRTLDVIAENTARSQQPIADIERLERAIGPIPKTPPRTTLADIYADFANKV